MTLIEILEELTNYCALNTSERIELDLLLPGTVLEAWNHSMRPIMIYNPGTPSDMTPTISGTIYGTGGIVRLHRQEFVEVRDKNS
jgi:hypothetical protein